MRMKLLFWMCLLVVLPMLVLQLTTYLSLKGEIQEKMELQGEEATNYLLKNIEKTLQLHQNDLLRYAAQTKTDKERTKDWQKEWKVYLEQYPNVNAVYFVKKENKSMLMEPVQELPEGFDPTNRSWYTKAEKAQGKFTWSDAYIDAVTGEWIITGSVLVGSDPANPDGVLGVDIKFDYMNGLIKEENLGYEGYGYVADEKGRALTHPTQTGKSLLNKPSYKGIGKKDGTIEFKEKGETYHVYYRHSQMVPWVVAIVYSEKELHHMLNHVSSVTAIVVILSLFVAFIVGWLVSKGITGPVECLVQEMKKVEHGELDVKVQVKGKDELSVLSKQFNSMTTEMRKLLREVKRSATELHGYSVALNQYTHDSVGASQEIARAMSEVSTGSMKQTEQLEEMTKRTEELSASIRSIHESVVFMNQLSQQTEEVSGEGVETLQALRHTTNDTVSGVDQVRGVVSGLLEKMKEIEGFVGVIRSISEQTDLLALNASLEAEKSGEQGKGFGVIAMEVKVLSEQSAHAAKQIYEMIGSIQTEAEQVSKVVHRMQNVQMQQNEVVKQTEDSFQTITNMAEALVGTVYRLTEDVERIEKEREVYIQIVHAVSTASEQAAATAEEVNASTDEQVQNVGKVGETANGLRQASEKLEAEIERFNF